MPLNGFVAIAAIKAAFELSVANKQPAKMDAEAYCVSHLTALRQS